MHPLQKMIENRRRGIVDGICCVCSANEYVVMAALDRAERAGRCAVIEATANQVNQYGGYTGMRPADFREFVYGIADKMGFPRARILLGGDHLGPLTWTGLGEEEAMGRAEALVALYVEAGFAKIHIDTSMMLADDDHTARLPDAVTARRGARLARACEEAFARRKAAEPDAEHPVYVIGSEVPIPGGTKTAEALEVTRPEDFEATVAAFARAFREGGAADALDHVIAVVIQPGVEFSNDSVSEYDPAAAQTLCRSLAAHPNLVFEGHSTDYQTRPCLRSMARDGIAIQKVGPALTFALREGLFALSMMEAELLPEDRRAHFMETLDAAMTRNPMHWKSYYQGTPAEQAFQRRYGQSDRCRYYLAEPDVKAAAAKLMENLRGTELPLPLISQYLPLQYQKIRMGELRADPVALTMDKVGSVIDDYLAAFAPASECFL